MLNVNFAGRHVFVAGGTSGINLGVAQAFSAAGATVSVISRNEEKVARAVHALSVNGGRAAGRPVDVRDSSALGTAISELVGELGPIDVVVSGAAGNFLCAADQLSPNGFRTVVDIDLNGSFNVVHATYPYLRKPGGSVIHISAPQATVPMRFQVHAAAAKAGVDQMTRVLALEWGAAGVRVNAISPGPIEGTEGFSRLISPDETSRESALENVPLRRFGRVEDIANLALFLGSEHASFLSGAVIPCDGGGALESVKPSLEEAGYRETM